MDHVDVAYMNDNLCIYVAARWKHLKPGNLWKLIRFLTELLHRNAEL